ncbi:MAG: ATP synthase F1 subunit epsilon [Eubacterium sp.]|nr:ATP synthase F1 subunit epsilon [Eubacterium sp.]MBR4241110.1 ATP synthase F1 subunit epsilon [Eubacterium sp.]
MNTFKLKIIGSKKTFFDGECLSLTLPIADGGQMGFLANHENTVAPLEAGEVVIKTAQDEVIDAFISQGFVEFFDNACYVVCFSVERPEEIDFQRAEEAKERAEEALRQKQSIFEYHQSRNDLARAIERLKIKNRYHN